MSTSRSSPYIHPGRSTGLILCLVLVLAAGGSSSFRAQASDEPIRLQRIAYDRNATAQTEQLGFVFSRHIIPTLHKLAGDKPRLFFDIAPVTSYTGPEEKKLQGPWLRSVRVFLHEPENRLRVVLDVNPETSCSVEQTFIEDKNLFLLTISGVQ